MKTDLEKIIDFIRKEVYFSLIRFGDGEENILNNVACKRQGFEYDPGDSRDNKFRVELYDSLLHCSGRKYFVGTNNFNLNVGATVISPAIFVNKNYLSFLNEGIRAIKERSIYFVGNVRSDISKLPFNIEKFYAIPHTAWRYEQNLHNLILEDLKKEVHPVVVLVAGGPFSNVLIHKLWKNHSRHSYVDIGSVLDPFLFGEYTRKYHERMKK